jgi:hypothetical protein
MSTKDEQLRFAARAALGMEPLVRSEFTHTSPDLGLGKGQVWVLVSQLGLSLPQPLFDGGTRGSLIRDVLTEEWQHVMLAECLRCLGLAKDAEEVAEAAEHTVPAFYDVHGRGTVVRCETLEGALEAKQMLHPARIRTVLADAVPVALDEVCP